MVNFSCSSHRGTVVFSEEIVRFLLPVEPLQEATLQTSEALLFYYLGCLLWVQETFMRCLFARKTQRLQ